MGKTLFVRERVPGRLSAQTVEKFRNLADATGYPSAPSVMSAILEALSDVRPEDFHRALAAAQHAGNPHPPGR